MNTPRTPREHSTTNGSEPNAEVLADAYRYILACGEKL